MVPLMLYFLALVSAQRYSLLRFTIQMRYIYTPVRASNVFVFLLLKGDGGDPQFPGPLADPWLPAHTQQPPEEVGGRRALPLPGPPACTTHLWPPWRTWVP